MEHYLDMVGVKRSMAVALAGDRRDLWANVRSGGGSGQTAGGGQRSAARWLRCADVEMIGGAKAAAKVRVECCTVSVAALLR